MKKIIVFFAALVACLFLLNTNLFSRQMATRPNPEAVDLRPDEFRKSTPLLVEEKVARKGIQFLILDQFVLNLQD